MNESTRKAITVLVADDDADDRHLIREAFEMNQLPTDVRFVEDGVALMEYLTQHFAAPESIEFPRPGVILLDLNMPRKDGWEALDEIKANPSLRPIPVVVLSTSNAAGDIQRSYEMAASSYIVKPRTFDGMVDLVKSLGKYWLETVILPGLPVAKKHG